MKKSKNGQKNTIHNPHDKALFLALKNHEIARDAMRAYLPPELLGLTDLKNIRLHKTKLITPEFKEFEADIIYEIELKGQSALLLFHCEHQSTIDKHISLRIWQYLLLVLMEHTKSRPKGPLPIVFPIVLYTGETPYNESTDFFDLFAQHKGLAQKYMLAPIKLVDVCRMADEDIKKHTLFGLSEFAFKHKKTKHFEKTLQTMLPWVHEIELQLGKDYAKMVLKYVIDVYPEANYETLAGGAKRYLSDELGDEAMTIAQQLRNEGLQQGMQQGIQQEKYIIAKNMLLENLEINLIARTTGLGIKDIMAIKKEIKEK